MKVYNASRQAKTQNQERVNGQATCTQHELSKAVFKKQETKCDKKSDKQ